MALKDALSRIHWLSAALMSRPGRTESRLRASASRRRPSGSTSEARRVPVRAGVGSSGRLLEVTQQLRKGNPEADRQHFEDAQASLPAPILQLGDVDAANS